MISLQPAFNIMNSIMMDFHCGVGQFVEIIVKTENNYYATHAQTGLSSRGRFIAVFRLFFLRFLIIF